MPDGQNTTIHVGRQSSQLPNVLKYEPYKGQNSLKQLSDYRTVWWILIK